MSDKLKEIVRSVGGIVHSDGNIFFTNAAQLEAAARLIASSQGAAPAVDGLPPLPEPVAWQYRFRPGGKWHLTDNEAEAKASEDGDWRALVAIEAIRSSQAGGAAQVVEKSLASHFSPFYLLSNARRICARHYDRVPNWVLAKELFAVGSTTANRICREAEIDPNGFDTRKVASLPAAAPVGDGR